MITIVPMAGVAGVPPMMVDDVCRSRGRSVYKIFGCGIGTANAVVLDKASAVASAIVLNFHSRRILSAAFNQLIHYRDLISIKVAKPYRI